MVAEKQRFSSGKEEIRCGFSGALTSVIVLRLLLKKQQIAYFSLPCCKEYDAPLSFLQAAELCYPGMTVHFQWGLAKSIHGHCFETPSKIQPMTAVSF